MAKDPMSSQGLSALIAAIEQETTGNNKKLEILFSSPGNFNASQAAQVIHQFASPPDKVQAIKIMEPRLVRMTCQEAREIINAISVSCDKLTALHCVKRVLSDSQTKLGEEYILSCFPFQMDKYNARNILYTVQSRVGDKMAAGGHQGYAALGGLYTQCRPLEPHLYGSLAEQESRAPGHGNIEMPITANAGVIPSVYTGHPSYAYPPDRTYEQDREYPGNTTFLSAGPYPAGAPPLGHHSGAPAPTGFPRLPTEAMGYQ
ncbi:uncharacterized protein LOC135466039 [Liolophura sinensis]|uniref:uncharacterized protein LOC135466039 n=1 Tax=Liolophura sinensis TaxID=3198878 RepID=UPI0031588E99